MRPLFRTVMGAALLALSASAAEALPVPLQGPAVDVATPVAQGCGPGWWRGPWGHCRDTPFYGRLPDGDYKPPPDGWVCPPGYWRGPWGHCRDTPYHGPLPGGGWK